MNSLFKLAGLTAAIGCLSTTQATILLTSNPADVLAFQTGATVENFDDLSAFSILNYDAGQTIAAGAKFSSRNGVSEPTFHSGGASFNDPVGNPGTPVGIFAPGGGISADVQSGKNVVGPLVINTDEPFNNGFMEIIFPNDVAKVGFWVTHGSISISLRDDTGNDHSTGDFTATASAGTFVGISRDAADIKIAALIANGTDAFTLDDVTFGGKSTNIPDTGGTISFAIAGVALLLAARKR